LKGTHLDHTLSVEDRISYLTAKANLSEMVSQLQNGASALPRFGLPAFQWLNDDQHGVGRTPMKATVLPNGCGLGATWSKQLLFEAGVVLGTEARGLKNYYTHNDSVRTTGDDHRSVNADHSASCTGCGITIYGPNLNLVRDPRWGRGQETFGEDPHLMGALVVAWVTGAQNNSRGKSTDANGKLLSGLCCKHFAAYDIENVPSERTVFDARVDARSMWETYMPAFEQCIKEARATHVMCSYNSVNGVPTCANSGLLNTILRDQWNFDGFVVSDYDAWANLLLTHHYVSDYEAAAAVGINNGLDQEGGNNPNPGGSAFPGKPIAFLEDAVAHGNVTRATIATAWGRQLRVRIRLGLLDPPLSDGVSAYNALDERVAASAPHLSVARRVAEASMTLLKNQASAAAAAAEARGAAAAKALPLELGRITTIALIGPQATDAGLLMGNYAESASNFPGWGTSILDALTQRVASTGVRVVHSAGELYCMYRYVLRESCSQFDSLPLTSLTISGCPTVACVANSSTAAAIAAAAAAAKNADVVIVTLGLEFRGNREGRPTDLNLDYEAEGHDRDAIELPGLQGELVAALREALPPATPLVGLLVHGGTLALGDAGDDLDAILSAWYPGIEGGRAIAATLAGDVSPAGRSASTWYRGTAVLPAQNGTMDEMVGRGLTYRYVKDQGDVVFPFGHGLSYSNFVYSNFTAATRAESPGAGDASVAACDTLTLSVVVANAGAVDSDEVVQIYAAFPDATVPTTSVRLVAFERVHVKAGARARVTLQLAARERAVVDPTASADVYHDARVVEAGRLVLSAGGGQPHYFVGAQSVTLRVSTKNGKPVALASCKK
jgi:beta-glucosidase